MRLMKRFARRYRRSLAIAVGVALVALALVSWPSAPDSLAPAVCAAAEVAPSGTTVRPYEPGCAERYAAEGKKAVLFFRAYWCGACAHAAAEIADEAPRGPSDLVVLEVDYDDSAELKRRYGVTLQHTFVQVGPDGEELGQWVGFETLAELEADLR
jgi:thiol-disulfide isomerase/thioredoxin